MVFIQNLALNGGSGVYRNGAFVGKLGNGKSKTTEQTPVYVCIGCGATVPEVVLNKSRCTFCGEEFTKFRVCSDEEIKRDWEKI